GKSFIAELTTSPEFFNLFRQIRKQQYLILEWALERIQDLPYKPYLDLGRKSLAGRGAFAAVTNVENLSDQDLPILGDDWFHTMLATCAITKLYHGPVDVNGQKFVDGGVSASLTVQEAWRQNARNILVIRTEHF
ncbi:esterase, partial [Vibrio parahaemolyticus]